ncbi:tetratricopeptide repeat-containing sensor histidine kinase [Hyunsoonleella aestuarii]|uniref:histidine kinase n=1 Tax=Hyunsoonleella aestuarii TaxID=912802 RepID=A0ABP8EB05_9FLAO|nr:sensor histidine kinase [Hyunsoonleella aestuarii]
MKKGLLATLLFAFSLCCFSQDNSKIIDSLKHIIFNKPSDSIKIKAFSDLCWYYRNVSTDSALNYGDKALQLSKNTMNLSGEAQAYNDIGIIHYGLADYDSAIKSYQKALDIRFKLKDSLGVAALYNKIGLVHQNTFKMDSALFYATKALRVYEDKNRPRYVALIKNNIANIYKGLKQYDKALHLHLDMARVNENNKDFLALTKSYNNIANAYLFLNDTVKSVDFYQKSIDLAETYNYKRELAALYNNYGNVLLGQKQYDKAVDLNTRSLKLREELKDNFGVSSTSLHLAGLYLNLKDLPKAKGYLYSGMRLAESFDGNELKLDAYDKMSSYYAYQLKPDSVIYYKELFKALKDTIFSKQVIKEVAEVQEKYNTAEREKKILSQRADIAEKELDINKKNTQLLGLVLAIILLSSLAYLIYYQQQLKNKRLKKESELKEALVKIETQNRLQEQRLNISRDLHDNIGAQLTFVISSIENLQYGFKIKDYKVTEKLKRISDFTRETIHELRDTIWAMNKNDITLEDLQIRISNFVKKANAYSEKTKFEFRVEEGLKSDIKFSSVTGMSIYRVIQEATNNAFKYAEAKKVSVKINQVSTGILVNIEDDGKGFDTELVIKGNGLNNMRKRAEIIEADFKIESEANKGTRVILAVSL